MQLYKYNILWLDFRLKMLNHTCILTFANLVSIGCQLGKIYRLTKVPNEYTHIKPVVSTNCAAEYNLVKYFVKVIIDVMPRCFNLFYERNKFI